MTADRAVSGEATSRGVIEVRVTELRQLFNAIDPSPFRERDLDPGAEAFIVDWSRELPSDVPLTLVVHLERSAGMADEPAILREAINQYFRNRAAASRRSLRDLFARGRISLAIALAFLATTIVVNDQLAARFPGSHFIGIFREGLLIGGWVAMWRPLEVFLYDWWPIRSEARLFDRLAGMAVEIDYKQAVPSDAWRSDWPAIPTIDQPKPGRSRETVSARRESS